MLEPDWPSCRNYLLFGVVIVIVVVSIFEFGINILLVFSHSTSIMSRSIVNFLTKIRRITNICLTKKNTGWQCIHQPTF